MTDGKFEVENEAYEISESLQSTVYYVHTSALRECWDFAHEE